MTGSSVGRTWVVSGCAVWEGHGARILQAQDQRVAGRGGAGLHPRWPSDSGPAPFLRHVHFLLPSTFAPAPTPPAGPLPGTVPLQNPATPREGALSPGGCPGRGLSSTADLRGGRGLRVLWASGGGASGRAACPSRSRSGMARCGQRVGRAASVTPRSWHPVSLGQTICSCFRVPTLRKRPSPTRLRPRPTATSLREREEASGRPGALVGCRNRVSAGLSSCPPLTSQGARAPGHAPRGAREHPGKTLSRVDIFSVVVFKQGRMSVSSSRDWGTQSSRD